MRITIPPLEREIYRESGVKSFIKQVLSREFTTEVNVIETTRSGLTVEHDNIKYYLTGNNTDIPADKLYVLLTNKKPTTAKIQGNEIQIKKWLKHPLDIDHTCDEVIASWEDDFFYKEENLADNKKGLRQPQLGAIHMIMGHLKLPLEIATIVLPTGTGKTETMLSALVANQCKRLLVIVPSDALRSQIAMKFLTLGLLKEFGIVGKKSLNPIVGIVKQGFNSVQGLSEFFGKCNVIVSTMNILTDCSEEQKALVASMCSNVFIDEAHHIKVATWANFKDFVPTTKIIQFTATPFRNDGKRLEGRIIFNFPLREAQKQGYFKQIDFIAVRQYDPEKADIEIANKAIERLRADLAQGKNHILMARCSTKERAIKILELYRPHQEFNPVIIYSGVPDFKANYEKIINKQTRIIVCVDMLGEGFDLPELKIAAFHDIRKSLPITLQFAGRFTRTKHDEELGNASFIANINGEDFRDEIEELYSRDADWNQILSEISYGRINDEVEFKELISGFSKLNNTDVPFQNIRVNLSTVVYKNRRNEWFPLNFISAINNYENLKYKFHDINRNENMLIIVTADTTEVDWINHKDFYFIDWRLIVVYWDTINNLLFINSSDNSSLYQDLAKAIIGDDAELIKGINVFKTFYNIKRIRLQNVGLRYFLGKDIRFRMMVGSDVAEALSIAEKQRGEKAFVMGIGYEEGEPVNLGASYKGRIWTKMEGDLKGFKNWSKNLGDKLINETIDPNQILKETLIPTRVIIIPNSFPVWIDWDVEIYLRNETKFSFEIGGFHFDLSTLELCLLNPSIDGILQFSLASEVIRADFELQLFEKIINAGTENEQKYPDFRILKLSREDVFVSFGNNKISAITFFEEYVPTVWFADGSALTGNEFIELKQNIALYPRDEIITWNWNGVDLSAESQGVLPINQNSIQYKVIQELRNQDFDIIYDDDYAGEIADIISIKLLEDKLKVNLYHLKYALDGVVSNRIQNMYEVCGQAQKSIRWKHKDGSEFFGHLLRRIKKVRNGNERSRLEKGTDIALEKLLKIAKKEIPIEFEIYIVQPGFSKNNATNEILTLLSVTENYIKEVAAINFKVIASE